MRAEIDRDLPEDIRAYIKSLQSSLNSPSVILFGSMAQGNPGRWSDYDLLLIADGLPEDFWERQELLWRNKPAFVDMIGFTNEEIRNKINRGLILDALLLGRVLCGNISELKEMAREYLKESNLVRTSAGYVHRS